jgi:hypothetical protein
MAELLYYIHTVVWRNIHISIYFIFYKFIIPYNIVYSQPAFFGYNNNPQTWRRLYLFRVRFLGVWVDENGLENRIYCALRRILLIRYNIVCDPTVTATTFIRPIFYCPVFRCYTYTLTHELSSKQLLPSLYLLRL